MTFPFLSTWHCLTSRRAGPCRDSTCRHPPPLLPVPWHACALRHSLLVGPCTRWSSETPPRLPPEIESLAAGRPGVCCLTVTVSRCADLSLRTSLWSFPSFKCTRCRARAAPLRAYLCSLASKSLLHFSSRSLRSQRRQAPRLRSHLLASPIRRCIAAAAKMTLRPFSAVRPWKCLRTKSGAVRLLLES